MTDFRKGEVMEQELKPCPFCKSENIRSPMQDAWKKWIVGCAACGAEGPQADTPGGAIVGWNRPARPSPQPASDSRGAHLAEVRQRMIKGDHNTVPVQPASDEPLPDLYEFLTGAKTKAASDSELVEAIADKLANADLDGPDPDDYWHYLAKAILPLIQSPDAAYEKAAQVLEYPNAPWLMPEQRALTQDAIRALKQGEG